MTILGCTEQRQNMVMDLCVRFGPTQLEVSHYDLIRTGQMK